MDVKKFLNWNEISRRVVGSRNVIMAKKHPRKHDRFVADLLSAIEAVLERYGVK
jgi:hypothetical protein